MNNYKTDILTENKSRCKSGQQCSINLLSFYSRVIDVLHQRQLCVLFEAFDKVSHKQLTLKLEHIGLKGSLLEWTTDEDSNKEQNDRAGVSNRCSYTELIGGGLNVPVLCKCHRRRNGLPCKPVHRQIQDHEENKVEQIVTFH